MKKVMMHANALLFCVIVGSLTGCKTTNGSYNLQQPIEAGPELLTYETDLSACIVKVEEELQGDSNVTNGTILGAAFGALVQSGGELKNIIAGAVVGATAGALGGNFKSHHEGRVKVINCMKSLGYNMADD